MTHDSQPECPLPLTAEDAEVIARNRIPLNWTLRVRGTITLLWREGHFWLAEILTDVGLIDLRCWLETGRWTSRICGTSTDEVWCHTPDEALRQALRGMEMRYQTELSTVRAVLRQLEVTPEPSEPHPGSVWNYRHTIYLPLDKGKPDEDRD